MAYVSRVTNGANGMSEMVKKVAQAIENEWIMAADFNDPDRSFPAAEMARAAIAAMREPTEAMTISADALSIPGADLHDFVAYDCSRPLWQAMIDEALR